MPWCPKCKNEYQEGITVCADCNIPLVDELPEDEEYKTVAFIAEEELAGKLVEYLEFSSVHAVCDYDESEESFAVKVAPGDYKEARKAFQAFYRVESTRDAVMSAINEVKDPEDDPDSISATLEDLNEEDLSDDEKRLLAQAIVSEQVYKPAEVYVTKSDVSKDMFSTALTFLAFAVLLFAFLILNLTGVLDIFNTIPSIITIGVLAAGCCLVGINAIKRSRKAELASHDEEVLTEKVKTWLDENITEETFAELDPSNLSEEILYLKRAEIIRNSLNKAFPGLNDDFADAMIDDFYDVRFGDNSSTADTAEDGPDADEPVSDTDDNADEETTEENE